MHIPGAAQACVKHHQITGPEPHRLTAIGGNGDISLQQQTGLLFVIAPGEAADPTAPDRPGLHSEALQTSWIRIGRNRDAAGHGGLHENREHCEP